MRASPNAFRSALQFDSAKVKRCPVDAHAPRCWPIVFEHAGDLPVDVLKVDVEGFELKVLATIPALLERTNTVVLEWHKWITDRAPVDAILAKAGLEFVHVVTEDPHCGVAFYARPTPL